MDPQKFLQKFLEKLLGNFSRNFSKTFPGQEFIGKSFSANFRRRKFLRDFLAIPTVFLELLGNYFRSSLGMPRFCLDDQ